jgi:hypothetical protein
VDAFADHGTIVTYKGLVMNKVLKKVLYFCLLHDQTPYLEKGAVPPCKSLVGGNFVTFRGKKDT